MNSAKSLDIDPKPGELPMRRVKLGKTKWRPELVDSENSQMTCG